MLHAVPLGPGSARPLPCILKPVLPAPVQSTCPALPSLFHCTHPSLHPVALVVLLTQPTTHHTPLPPPHLPTFPIAAVSDFVEMFRVHGDIHSFLYTGSPAMHSHVLNLVVQVCGLWGRRVQEGAGGCRKTVHWRGLGPTGAVLSPSVWATVCPAAVLGMEQCDAAFGALCVGGCAGGYLLGVRLFTS